MTTDADAGFWNAIAEEYARKPVADPDAFERKIAITLERMDPERPVLDIGCGTGSLALRLAPHAEHVHGLDVSREMVRIARGKAEAAGAGNVTFHEGSFEDAARDGTFAPGTLGAVCAYSVLHLVPDRAAVLASIRRLLAPGGLFVASTACLGDSWVPYRPLLRAMRWMGKAPSVRIFTRAELEAEVRQAGFVDVTFPDVGAKPAIAFMVATSPG